MSPFTYVVASVGMVWLAMLLASDHTRFEQLVMSLFGFLVAPAALLMSAPLAETGFAELLFVAIVFGISAVTYHSLLESHADRLNGRRERHPAHWVSHLLMSGGIWVIIAIAARLVFAMPRAQAFALGGLLVGVYALADHRDLLLKALLSGAIVSILVFATEAMFAGHLFAAVSLTLEGLPVEELLWAGVVGFTAGPVYEFARHVRST
jgi:hypothetical protein